MLAKSTRKVLVVLGGGALLLLGVVMIVTPGPGILGILGGLAILATEFVWASLLLKRIKAGTATIFGRRRAPDDKPPPAGPSNPQAAPSAVPASRKPHGR